MDPIRMRLPYRLVSLVVIAALANGPVLAATPAPPAGPPPLPGFHQLPLPGIQEPSLQANGDWVWLADRRLPTPPPGTAPASCWPAELVLQQWNPATGVTRSTPLQPSLQGTAFQQLPLAGGLLALTTTACQQSPARTRLLWLPKDGKPLALETAEPLGAMPVQMFALGEAGAVLVTRIKASRHIKVYTVRIQAGQLLLDSSLPPLPIAYRADFTSALAGADRLMILGGSDAPYRGCAPCRAETQVLDLKQGRWSAGPRLLEARSELAAANLPDGSILVSGGWTEASPWSGRGPSATVERWSPASNRFEREAAMPSGNALHRLRWWTLPWGRTLVATDGISGSAAAYEPASRSWRLLGAWKSGSDGGACATLPFAWSGQTLAWRFNRTDGGDCVSQTAGMLGLLRPPKPAQPVAPDSLLIDYRSGASLLPAQGPEPALLIGGFQHVDALATGLSSGVVAMDAAGRSLSHPSLLRARAGALALRIAGGSLVLGGQSDKQDERLPIEWLGPATPGSEPRWQLAEGAGVSAAAALAPLPDGSGLLEVEGAEVRLLRLSLRRGQPVVERSDWPAPQLGRERRPEGDGPTQRVQVRALADGRVIVAGGLVRAEKVALLTPQAERADAGDSYVGIGPLLPSRRHEIYDPATRRWSNSAPSRHAGGSVFIFDDGRVAKLGRAVDTPGQAASHVLEVSNAAGTAWTTLARPGSRLLLNDYFQLFSLDGELLARGELEGLQIGGAPSGVEWLNPATQRWEPLWQASPGDNWRDHLGRVLRRTLAGAEGRSKTLIIPVGATP